MKKKEMQPDRQHEKRNGTKDQPTNNKPAAGERGKSEDRTPHAQKTAGRGDRGGGSNSSR